MGRKHLVPGKSHFVRGICKPEGNSQQGGTFVGKRKGTQEGNCPERPQGATLKG